MNLGKLLAAGKCIVKGNETIEYRENKQTLLPKFVPSKKAPARSSKPSLEAADTPAKETEPAPAESERIPQISGTPKSLAAWTSKLNPASVWRGSRMEEKNSKRPEIQAELSLNTVKVVHNDLSDADVEIVPIKSRPMPAVSAPPAKKTWEILGERLLKATAL